LSALVKQLVRVGLHRFGGLKPVLWRTRRSFRILTYHRFSNRFHPGGPESLRRQCVFLKRNFEVLPLSHIGECLRSGTRIPDRALAITIDDGYRDILLDACPVFQEAGIPATVFLITGFLDRKLWPWWNQVEYAIQHSRKTLVETVVAGQKLQVPLQSAQQRDAGQAAICSRLVQIPNSSRLAFLRALPELFELDIPPEPPLDYAPLSWDEVRSLTLSGIEFGAHTQTHPVLPSIEDPEEIKEEIVGSKARIDRELGCPTPCFCYPNGDVNGAVLQVVKQAGFEIAVTTRSGMNAPGEDPYLLKRLSVDPGLPDFYFREQVASLHAH
jgi:peptidoglycan/xylan/chitin deacetylase (PgdA/CDA1 family)